MIEENKVLISSISEPILENELLNSKYGSAQGANSEYIEEATNASSSTNLSSVSSTSSSFASSPQMAGYSSYTQNYAMPPQYAPVQQLFSQYGDYGYNTYPYYQHSQPQQQMNAFSKPYGYNYMSAQYDSSAYLTEPATASVANNASSLNGSSVSNEPVSESSVSSDKSSLSAESSPLTTVTKKTNAKKSKKVKKECVQPAKPIGISKPFQEQNVSVQLSNRSLWESFNAHTTEMIITKQGR